MTIHKMSALKKFVVCIRIPKLEQNVNSIRPYGHGTDGTHGVLTVLTKTCPNP